MEVAKALYVFVEKGYILHFFEPCISVTFEPKSEKKRKKYNVEKIQDEVRAYLQDIVEREDWTKLLTILLFLLFLLNHPYVPSTKANRTKTRLKDNKISPSLRKAIMIHY